MIYYIFEHRPNLSGVNKKIISKINVLNKLGVPIKGLVVNLQVGQEKLDYDSNLIEIINYRGYSGKHIFKNRILSFLQIYYKQKSYYKFLNEEIQKRDAELIIKRYEYEDYNTLQLLKKSKVKFLFEVNTDQLEQIISNWSYKGLFKSPTWQSYYVFQEKNIGPKILTKAAGVITVTGELKARVDQKTQRRAKSFVVSNGIESDKYELVHSADSKFDLSMLMILGVDSDWNGLDVIINEIERSKSLNVQLIVVGNVKAQSTDTRIKFLGLKSQDEIGGIINDYEINVGVGTLALQRKGITEASPLKVREYLSRGLPVIYNYEDTDLDGDESFANMYHLKFTEKLDIQILIDRYQEIKEIPDFNSKIKDWASNNIDYSIKLAQYKSVIEEII